MTAAGIRPEILDAIEKVQAQLESEPFCDCGVLFSQHGGEIRRIDYSMTVKIKPTGQAASSAHNNR